MKIYFTTDQRTGKTVRIELQPDGDDDDGIIEELLEVFMNGGRLHVSSLTSDRVFEYAGCK